MQVFGGKSHASARMSRRHKRDFPQRACATFFSEAKVYIILRNSFDSGKESVFKNFGHQCCRLQEE